MFCFVLHWRSKMVIKYAFVYVLFTQQLIFAINAINEESNYHNILFILVDDLRHLSIENVHLPNIEKLTARGINFEHAYAQQALCAPSRNSLLTGRRPDSLRLYDFYSYWRDTQGNFTTIPQFFKNNGYETYSVGKVFHPGKSSNYTDDYPHSWSHVPYHPATEIYKDAPVCRDTFTGKLESNLVCPVNVNKQPGRTLPDIESLDYAINILTEQRSKPLFLAVGFHKPHIPIKFPKKFLDNIPIDKVQPPRFSKMPKHMPMVAWHPWTDVRSRHDIKRLNISFPLGTMPDKWTLQIRQSYFAAATYIDDIIGALINNVDMGKTIVVLTSDHGWSLGENGLWAKYSNFDVALRVPLVFIAPGLTPTVIHTPVELVDIFPTLVDLANLKRDIPRCKNIHDKRDLCFEGSSLMPMMKSGNTARYINFAQSQYPRPSENPQKNSDKPRLRQIKIMGYSIRTKQYRYTEWVCFNSTSFKINWNILYGMELYNHIIDPEESNNLYLVSKYKDIQINLSNLLRSNVDKQHTKTELTK